MSYLKDNGKLKSNIEKGKVQHIGSKNIKIESKLSNKEITNINEECDRVVDFDDTFKHDKHILSIISKAKGKID